MINKLSIGNDHAGYDLKKEIINWLIEYGIFEIYDCGTDSKDSCDYPDIAHKTIEYLIDEIVPISILICGSGVGMSMCANRWRDARAALCWNTEISSLSRQHNDANVLCLPARFLSTEEAIDIVKTFIETEFEGGRHKNRVNKITPKF